MKVCFETIGCKLNQVESESLCANFKSYGFSIVPFKAARQEDVGLFIFNTCTVTSMAQQKARRLIRLVAKNNGQAVLIISGCYAQLDRDEIITLGKNIVVATMEQKSKLMKLPFVLCELTVTSPKSLKESIVEFLNRKDEYDPFFFQALPNLNRFSSLSSLSQADLFDNFIHSRAMVKIQDGCNCRCNYCRIPLARGNSISLSKSEVLERAKWFLDFGYREIVLTGINISDWSAKDEYFANLLYALANLVRAYKARIRLSSIEPHNLNEALFEVLLDDAIVPHLHVAFQSFSNKVLQEMNRVALTDKIYLDLQSYKTKKGNPFLATDILCGFDGESNEDFLYTCKKIKEIGFAHLHVFPFSPREGTVSFVPKHPVPQRVRDERALKLRELSQEGYCHYLKNEDGAICNLLIEGLSLLSNENGDNITLVQGVSENYLRPQVVLKKEQKEKIVRGGIYPCKLTLLNEKLIGELLI